MIRCFPAVRPAAMLVLAATLLLPIAQAQVPAAPTAGPTPAGMSGDRMDMKAMMKEQHDKMAAMPMTGDPDADFAMAMRIHHLGAIDMAEAELRSGKNPQMRKMARSIIAAQKKEIVQFDRFLTKHAAEPKK